MTPEAKAKYLAAEMSKRYISDFNYHVKHSCIICVKEVLKELECAYNGDPITTNKRKEYWKQVQKQLNEIL